MSSNRSFAIQTLIVVALLNGLLVAVLHVLGGEQNGMTTLVLGLAFTLALWGLIQWIASRQEDAKAVEAAPAPPVALPPPSNAPALQLLSILQRKGRLIDFLQEDLRAFDDAQVGAAVRTIHAGCKAALAEHITLAPVYEQAEGSAVTLDAGFDARATRLVGNVAGEPPFQGTLRHRGWQAIKVNLPERLQQDEAAARIIAPAEVEV